MIRLEGISKTYKTADGLFYALNNIDLYIKSGESVAIRGRSGAGKSTLLHILGCLDTYSKGRYFLDGNDLSEKSAAEEARLRNQYFGFVLQDFSLINHQTALYNVMAPMFFNKTPIRQMRERAMTALEAMGVADQAKKNITNMSGGQRQRVAIARAIVNNPSIILADEPTGSLDSRTTKEVLTLLNELKTETGVTVIQVTHSEEAALMTDRIIKICDGRISE